MPLVVLSSQRRNFELTDRPRMNSWYPEDGVNMHLVIIKQRNPRQMCSRNEIEDVGAGSAEPDDGDFLTTKEG